ncbi:hypothetical protein F3Y22_tig00110865pilonHSYRG00093 [Hibiscus syriacus]|uniref:Cathepsin propeptide inhibitor domain-containing protein n=1 Tax=Hibiscus syriacus TaxID=106335 RepID=A0A6A2ZLP0_HIBSY|nr:hypothetical protein F3Y22_tig00110865pilonHSYRG00093 [Hibiscus syriacus]
MRSPVSQISFQIRNANIDYRNANFDYRNEIFQIRCDSPNSRCDLFQIRVAIVQVRCDSRSSHCDLFQVRCDSRSSRCDLFQVRCDSRSSRCDLFQVRCDSPKSQRLVNKGDSRASPPPPSVSSRLVSSRGRGRGRGRGRVVAILDYRNELRINRNANFDYRNELGINRNELGINRNANFDYRNEFGINRNELEINRNTNFDYRNEFGINRNANFDYRNELRLSQRICNKSQRELRLSQISFQIHNANFDYRNANLDYCNANLDYRNAIVEVRVANLETDLRYRRSRFELSIALRFSCESAKEKRFNIFKENLEYIESFNSVGNRGFKLGLNEFADLRHDEFIATHTGYHKMDKSESTSFKYANYSDISMVQVPLDMRIIVVYLKMVKFVSNANIEDSFYCELEWFLGISAVAAVESLTQINTGKLTSLSEQQLVDCSRNGGNQGCNSGVMVDAYQYLIQNRGIAAEQTYPYNELQETCDKVKQASKVETISV